MSGCLPRTPTRGCGPRGRCASGTARCRCGCSGSTWRSATPRSCSHRQHLHQARPLPHRRRPPSRAGRPAVPEGLNRPVSSRSEVVMRSVWLVLGSVLTVVALVAATVIVWMAVALARNPMEVARRSIAFSGAALNVKTTSAGVNLFITRGDAGQIVLERRSRWSAAKPVVTEGWDGVNLVLDVACPGMDSSGEGFCESDYTLSLPPETALTATAFQGSLEVH